MSERNLPVPPELGHLSAFIDSHIECLAGPSSELCSLALCAAKHIFDWALETEESSKPHLQTLLATLTETTPPQTRSRARSTSATKRRSPSPMHKRQKTFDIRETPLPSLFVEGMNIDQIWQQLDLRAARVCENLKVLQGDDEDEEANLEEEDASEDADEDQDGGGDEDEDETAEMDVDGDESLWEGLDSEEEENISSTAEHVVDLQDESSGDEDEDENPGPPVSMLDIVRGQRKMSLSKSSSPDSEYPSLDDGFFDLATFNAETSELEAKQLSKRKLNLISDEDSAEESEVDFFGSVDDLETNATDDGLATELFYDDFFEPPPGRMQNGSRRSSKVRFHDRVSVKKIKAVGKGMPVSFMDEDDEDSDSDEDEDQ